MTPIEQLQCDVAMSDETDVLLVREALREKLRHLMELGARLTQLEKKVAEKETELAGEMARRIRLEETVGALREVRGVGGNEL